MDKVQKIREEVERIQLYTQSEVLKQVLDYIDEVQKEPVNEDFEKNFISMVNATHENNGSYSLHDFAQRLYNIAKEELEEPVSEDLEEYSALIADELPQGTALTSNGEFDIVSVRKLIINACKHGANWQKEKDLSPSTELSNFIDKLSKQFPEVSFAKLSRIAVRVAKWQQQQEYTCYEEAFEDGAKWKAEQFEKNRLKHCDSITNEQAELEQGFIDQHLDKYQRIPTFLDAIEYGMQTMKEQMMTKAIDGTARPDDNEIWCNLTSNNLEDGDKVKVIVIKED